MPSGINDLECAYTHTVQWRAIREGLRRARDSRGMTLKEASAETARSGETPISLHTIHAIENVKREPDLKPEFETVDRLVNVYGLTLSSFFLQIERQTDGSLQSSAGGSRTAQSPEESIKRRGAQARPAALDASTLLKAGNALVDAGGLFIAAAHGVTVEPQQRDRARDPVGGSASRPRRRAGGNR